MNYEKFKRNDRPYLLAVDIFFLLATVANGAKHQGSILSFFGNTPTQHKTTKSYEY
jgi:hypothetical protein